MSTLSEPLFSLPISSGGSFELTSPDPKIYLLTFTSPPDNRVTAPFIQTFLLALDIAEHLCPSGSALITKSGIEKFYSNGFDIAERQKGGAAFGIKFHALIQRLLTYPMPIISLVNGHAFGAGVFLAIAQDYRLQNPSRGFICLPEIDLGMLIPNTMQVMCLKKMTPATYRAAVLEGRRFGGPEGLEAGLVDALGGLDEAIKFVKDRKLVGKGGSRTVWGGLKEDAWRDVLISIKNEGEYATWRENLEKEKVENREISKKNVEEWESTTSKAKI